MSPTTTDPSPALRRVVGSVSVVGAIAVLGSALLASELPDPWLLLAAAATIALGDLPIVHVRHGDQNHTFTWAEAALVVGLVLLPAWWLPGVGAAVVALEHALLRRPPIKVAFNAGSYAAGAFLASAIHVAVGNRVPDHASWAALAVSCAAYYVWDTGSVSLVISRSQGVPLRQVLHSGFALATLFAIANASVAILVATAATREPMVLLTIPPVLVQLLFAYRNTREVISERDLWETIQQISVDLQRATADVLPGVALAAVHDLVGGDLAEVLVVEGDRARLHSLRDGRVETSSGPVIEIADDVWGRAECDRSSFWLRASSASPRQRAWLDDEHAATALVVPLEWGGAVIGLIRVAFGDAEPGSPRVESVLSTLATQVASAIASHRQTATLVHQAEHDQLTGLPNRTLLVDELGRRLRRLGTDGRGLAVLFFDLDGFKVVNDSLGHHVGDDLLLEAARRLRHAVRAQDVVARFGGDEFVVVCDGLRSPADAGEIARSLLDALALPTRTGARTAHIAASAGIAYTEAADTPADSMLRDADAAMYEAKRTAPGSFCAFNADLRTKVLDRMHLEADLRVALERGEIEVHFQPVIDQASGTIRELEALARWHHAERGPISPTTFVAIAEQSGQIRRLGELVLQQACADMRRWLDLGLVGTGQRVAVNLSAQQLDSTLPTVVGDALARHGLPPTALTLEVTESDLVDDPDAVASLQRLQAIGVSVSLDDFGTGYSSLSALRDLPVDVVKIDRSFVSRLDDDHQIQALVRGIVDLAHALELRVVAEGVEDDRQSSMLASFGCDHQQGWLHGRPMTSAMVEATLSGGPRLRVVPAAG